MKKLLAVAVASLLAFTTFAAPKYQFNSKKALKDKQSKSFNTKISAIDLVSDMKTGWNLGNTLDANGKDGMESETSWGMPLTTKEMIDGIAKSGFKTIRIPTSWANHFIDDKYTIDPNWMKRVKEIVDWAIANDMYVILNTHHDNYDKETAMSYGQGYYPSSLNYNESMRYVKNVWAQISQAFNKGYDEHLIFELLNEPRLRGHGHEWAYEKTCQTCKNGASTLNKLNQFALDAIRASGKNNANRFVMVTGLAAKFESYLDDSFVFPKDTADDKLILSVHLYTPYQFAIENSKVTEFNNNHRNELKYDFDFLNEKFISKGIPVVIGEYGATNKNNLEERIKWFKYFLTESGNYGMCSCLWDNGDFDAAYTFEEKFGFYNRQEQSWYFPEITEAIMEVTE